MKRPMLVCGVTAVIICALLIIWESAFAVIPFIATSVLLLYFIKHKRLKKHIMIPTVCIVAIIFTIAFFIFNKTQLTPCIEHHNTTNHVYGKIITLPEHGENVVSFTIKADKIGNNNTDIKAYVFLYGSAFEELELFDYISVPDAYLTVPTDDNYDYNLYEASGGTFLICTASYCERMWECEKTPYYYCLLLKKAVCDKAEAYLNTNQSALLKGMLFGDKADLDYSTQQSFRNAGISHLLAVSGLHTSLWCGLLISFLSAFKVSEKSRNIVCLIFLIMFCIVSAFAPSVIRASVMTASTLISPFFKRMAEGLNSLGTAVVFILLFNPYVITNIGFQLSATATFGVLLANKYSHIYTKVTDKITIHKLRTVASSLLSSLLISLFTSAFTLLISVYHFGVISLATPLSNLLCIQLAFYGMIMGIVSIALSFITLPFISAVVPYLFRITEFLLDILIFISAEISDVKYCSIPVNISFLTIAVLTGALIFIPVYLICKDKHKPAAIKITAIMCAMIIVLITFIPPNLSNNRNSVTIASAGNSIQLIVRSGLSYAFIDNSTQALSASSKEALPKATCEKLEYYVATYYDSVSVFNLNSINSLYSPKNIVLSDSALECARYSCADIPEYTTKHNNLTFTLNNEITVEIVDTYSIKYAIIKGQNKSVFVHLYGDADFNSIIHGYGCEYAVFNGLPQVDITQFVDTIIICSDDNINLIEAYNNEKYCHTLRLTARDGKTTLNI